MELCSLLFQLQLLQVRLLSVLLCVHARPSTNRWTRQWPRLGMGSAQALVESLWQAVEQCLIAYDTQFLKARSGSVQELLEQ